ncbi:MAG: DUF2797 domain-containing protein [Gammaproteobacteria bacterium]|nr:DUF2797 domain-containing protein [Gammaproteobacteria bacterium]MDH3412639.1 DUF2797 domain-containing protein [Gammaproteobacteria bacterium]
MSFSGELRKMRVEDASPVRYFMRLGDLEVALNPLIGERVTLEFTGPIRCIACGRETKKSFNQGYCFPCFRSLARCDRCIVSPELCHFHLGTCREPEWGQANCMQPHVVYLANSSGVKVGITRRSQIPTRWIDQGATQAMPLIQVVSRRASGVVEVALKSQLMDRTDWRRMLKGPPEPADLVERAEGLLAICQQALETAGEDGGEEPPKSIGVGQREFDYPVLEYPSKVRSINAEKQPRIQARLLGIKGQYLIFDCGVINMRKYAGHEAALL